MPVTVTSSGPLFDGRLERAITAGLDQAQQAVAQQGVNDVHAELGQVLQHPTGFYASHIVTERARTDWAVTDGNVVYGPWLAGTSTRNRSTRFKGYAHWRRAAARLRGKATGIANRVISQRIGGL